MKKNVFIKVFVISILLFLSKYSNCQINQFQERPNIIIIMADDMGYGDPKCYNQDSKIPTPNMDLLSQQGVLFTDAHSASSVCTPSRYALLTGRYCWRSRLKKGVLWSGYDDPLISSDRKTIASMLKKHGYSTAVVGKWHLGMNFLRKNHIDFVQPKTYHEGGLKGSRDVDFNSPIYNGPNYLGFDYSFVSAAGHNMEPHCYIENDFTLGIPKIWREANVSLFPNVSGKEVHEGWMIDGWDDRKIGPDFTAKAINFIKQSYEGNSSNPFFLYFATTSPHRPCTPPDFIKGRSNAGDRGDMVAEFDWTVGEIMKTLDSLGISDNTLIIVTSDNGGTPVSDNGENYGHKSCGDLKGFKASLNEGGHRVPFIVRWPGILSAGNINNGLVCLSDIFATVAAIVDEKVEDKSGEDSFNLLPLFMSNKNVRSSIIHHDYNGNFAIRKDDWKLILKGNQGVSKELYNLKDDPQEENNLAEKETEIVAQLSKLLNEMKRNGHSY